MNVYGLFRVLGMALQGLNSGIQLGMGMKKIKVYTLTDEGSFPKCIGTMKGEDEESLADLRVCLEEKEILNLNFSIGIQ